jgi:hypothetical protein
MLQDVAPFFFAFCVVLCSLRCLCFFADACMPMFTIMCLILSPSTHYIKKLHTFRSVTGTTTAATTMMITTILKSELMTDVPYSIFYFSCNKRCLCTSLAARDASLYCEVHKRETCN